MYFTVHYLLTCFNFFVVANAASDENSKELSLNIFTDLAPLLALFGEQFARQFMSETLTWPDHFIFAMVPLGILTAVVGAIRVSGPRWTRAIIGRARETRAFAEFELMSSTSHEVCELFNGRYIIRAMGKPQLEQFILFDTSDRDERACERIHTLQSALGKGLIQYHNYDYPEPIAPTVDTEQPDAFTFPKDMNGVAPNMQLNISISSKSIVPRSYMLLFFALLSTTLQLSVLIVSGFTVYNQALSTRIGASNSTYGFPLFLAGTVLLVVGMLICSYTIEQSTIERSWSRKEKRTDALGIIWLQRKQSVNDQSFDPFLIVGGPKNYIITSTRVDPRSGDKSNEMTTDHATFVAHVLALSGAVFGLLGFFLQFQGLRGLSWPSSVAQLIAIILMTVIRASVRYSVSRRPKHYIVAETFEMEWLSLRLVLCRKDQFPTPFLRKNRGEISPQFSPKDSLFWKLITAEISPSWKPCYASRGTFRKGEIVAPNQGSPESASDDLCDHKMILKVRQRLGILAQWESPSSKDAISLCKAIESVMNHFFPQKPDNNSKTFTWSLQAQIGNDTILKLPKSKPSQLNSHIPRHSDSSEGIINFAVEYTKDGWKANFTAFDAALSLWMSHLQTKQAPNHLNGLHQRAGTEVRYWRVIGDNSDKILESDLRWWINDALAEEILTRDAAQEVNDPSQQLLIGFQGFEPEDRDGNVDLITPQAFSNDLSSQKTIPALAIQRSGALPNVLAQHVFSAFMWGLAAEISHDKIGSGQILQSEKFSEANIMESWTSPSLQTQELARFAQGVERTGLCSLDEAYLSIIPPLSRLQKLPNEVVVTLAREREANRHLDWDETSKIYLDILRQSVINKPCQYFSSIVAAAIEVLFLVSEPLLDKSNVGKICKEAVELKDALKIMLKRLGTDQETFLKELIFLYKKQNRDLAFEGVLREIYNTPLRTPDYQIPTEHRSAWWRLTDDHFKSIESENSTGLKLSERDIFGWTPLHYAVTTGNRNLVIRSKSLPILADMAGRTPVHYAAKCGDYKILENLLGMEMDKKKDAANKIDREGMLPLHLAAQSGNAMGVVKLLLPYTNDINLRDKWGRTALYLAAENGSREIVEILLEMNGNNPRADIGIKCDNRLHQRTALHAAVASKHHSILAMLAGIDGTGLNWKDLELKTALELAVENDCELSIAALVEVFESTSIFAGEADSSTGAPALESNRRMSRELGRSSSQKSTAIRYKISTDFRFSQQREIEIEAPYQTKKDNETFKMCHWEEALDISIIKGRKNALVKMIELSKGTSREQTWAHAMRTAAKEGKEVILTLILGDQVQSKNKNEKKADSLRTSSNIAHHTISTKNTEEQLLPRPIDNGSTDATEGGRGRQLEKVIASLAKTIEMKSLVDTMDEEYHTPLFLAASNGYVNAVKLLLGEKANAEIPNEEESTPLNYAAASGHEEVVRTLLANGADKEAEDINGWTPLRSAVLGGHVKVIVALLENGADTEAVAIDGYTPLMASASADYVEVVHLLLEGANMEAADWNKSASLNLAAEKGHVAIVRMLLKKGANLEATNKHEWTPLHSAAFFDHVEVIKILLKEEANIEATDKFGLTTLSLAARKGHLEVAKALLEKQANKEAADIFGLTPLNLAAIKGHPAVVKILLKEGAQKESADENGLTPLHSAAILGHAEVAEALLKEKANTEAADKRGLKPLNLAVRKGHLAVVRMLLENGANTKAADEFGWTSLNSAANRGHAEIAELLLKEGANIEAGDEDKSTPLTLAVRTGHLAVVKMLLKNGANTEATDEFGLTPLNSAAKRGHAEIAKVLLEKGANKDTVNEFGWTPLNLSTFFSQLEVVKMLLGKKANVEAIDMFGSTPLNLAAKKGHLEIVEALLEEKANIEAADKFGSTPLNSAAKAGHLAVVGILLEKGANMEAVDDDGLTPLDSAANEGRLDIVEALLEKEAKMEAGDEDESTLLTLAVRKGHLAVARFLLGIGANTEAADKYGWTPLNTAAMKGHAEIAKVLLEKGANADAMNEFGRTPLNLSAVSGQLEIVKMLLEKKADVEATDMIGLTPLNLAAKKGHLEIVEALLEKKANIEAADKFGSTPLNSAAQAGHLAVVGILLEKGANMEAVDDGGLTPLDAAANEGCHDIVKALLEKEAKMEAGDEDESTLLTLAVRKGHLAVVRILLEKGANTEAADKYGWTSLNTAAIKGHAEIAKVLLENGANTEVLNKYGGTPLCLAAFFGHVKVVMILLEKRANKEAADTSGRTPLSLAARKGHLEVAKALLERQANKEAADIFRLTPLNLAAIKGHLLVVRILLEKGAQKESADENGLTPLHSAAIRGHAEVAEALLKEKANTEAADKRGLTPLNLAVKKGHLAVVRMLLEKGANMEAADEFGWTSLNSAANRGYAEIAEVLLDKGANIEAGDEDESTPLTLAARKGHLAVVKILLEKGANAEAADEFGLTPLNSAAKRGHAEIAKVLLEKGANTDRR